MQFAVSRLWLKRHLRAVALAGLGLAVRPSCLWPYSLRGASEAPTILLGDTFVVNRAAYDFPVPYSRITMFHVGSPRRGDIVQAYLPSRDNSLDSRALGPVSRDRIIGKVVVVLPTGQRVAGLTRHAPGGERNP